MSEITQMDALSLGREIADGKIRVAEATEAYLASIQEHNRLTTVHFIIRCK